MKNFDDWYSVTYTVQALHDVEGMRSAWKAASRRTYLLSADLEKAKRELQTAEEHLAMWLLPDDAKEGEKFCVWYGDSLISAQELPGDGGYEVTIRKRGKSLMA